MSATFIKNIRYLIDGTGTPLEEPNPDPVHLRFENGIITGLGSDLAPHVDDEIIEAGDRICYPGWINTHHHLFQSVLKGVSSGINERLFGWLNNVTFPRVGRISEASLRTGVQVGLAELLLSGTTTCADHHYIYYRDLDPAMADLLFEEAEKLGIRFTLCRGGQLKEDVNRDYPNQVKPESLDEYFNDIQRLCHRYHQSGPMPSRQVVLAPNTPTFSMLPEWLPEAANVARDLGIFMHSHLSETENYVNFCREVHNTTPVEFVAAHDWVGHDVWFAHMVHVSTDEMKILGATGTGISHCPASNGRLGSGFARVLEMEQAGAGISVGVDGAASNEQANMLAELRLTWLIQRALNHNTSDVTVEKVIHWGSAAGAQVLGLEGVGTLAIGQAADFTLYRTNKLANIGMHEQIYAPILCGEATADMVFCQGQKVVVDGLIPDFDLEKLRADARQAIASLR